MAKGSFREEHDLAKRRAEAARIREKYPDRIPVIVEKAENSSIPILTRKSALMSTMYEAKQDEDGFLYVTYSGENTFGDKILP